MKTPAEIAIATLGKEPNNSDEWVTYRALIAAVEADRTQRARLNHRQYGALCTVINRAKYDDISLDVGEYAAQAMDAVGVRFP